MKLFFLNKVLLISIVLMGVSSTFFLTFDLNAQERRGHQKYIGMAVGNDILNSTDRYLTQTTTFWMDWQSTQKMPLYQFLPTVKNQVGERWRIALSHDIYTPDVKETSDSIKIGDHPFSANLFLSLRRQSWNEERTVQKSVGVSFGVTGAAALGGEIQNFVHEITPSIIVKGWQYQHPGRMYWGLSWEQMYQLWSNQLNTLALYPIFKGAVGSVKNYGRAGVYGIFGNFGSPIGNKPFGNVKYEQASKRSQLALEMYLGVEGMLYDGNIQGPPNQTLLSSWEVSLEPWRVNGYVGGLISYLNLEFKIRQYFITKQFSTGQAHKWVDFSVEVGF